MTDRRPRVGISACLLGDEVRYDGRHKRDAWLVEVLGRYVDWVRVCPEVEVGMGIPREPVRLVRMDDLLRMRTYDNRHDYTAAMAAWARQRVEALADERLCGYVLKASSPSCGLADVPVFDEEGVARWRGRGLFADALVRRFPGLPVEDEGRLADPGVRESFMERVLTCHRQQER